VAKKLYYKIGEACKVLDIQPYVLRYWEKEFPFLSPDKNRSGQRVYSQQELDTIRRIKELLYEEGYTIAGAKKKLEAESSGRISTPQAMASQPDGAGPAEADDRYRTALFEVRDQLREILTLLDKSGRKAN
jgi:DNA-binding transcriptional MerR regulator